MVAGRGRNHVMPHESAIRVGSVGDAERLAALGLQVWLHTYATGGISQEIAQYVLTEFTAAKFSTLLTKDSVSALVAEIEGNAVAYAVVEFGVICKCDSRFQVELAMLYVQERFARRGIGSSLLCHAEELARQRNRSALWLTVNARNAQAIEFYASHGKNAGTAYFELGDARHENHVLTGPDT